ncbi:MULTISPECIES: DUF3551 domain-containing protein [unclassified Bradyrhizobium]|uniref:DUF3551 domain-containing protein n=3 Tax=Nitrobacteraceae TaxID=41294 RepID=UPI0028966FB1|nr:DUF3551 domain-containing protein [Bradyrhizobium sp. WBAH10]
MPGVGVRAMEHLLRREPAREVQAAASAPAALIMMRALACLLLVLSTMSAPSPAAAQRFGGNYPVCMQRWEWGGVTWISCQYRSWDECRASAAGLSAMCMDNPYAQRPLHPERSPRSR